jgi:hypothetical protein
MEQSPKLLAVHLHKIFLAFYGSTWFITVVKKAHHWAIS